MRKFTTMMKRFLVGFLLISPLFSNAQTPEWQTAASDAYNNFPEVPHGLLEAVAFVQTRMTHLDVSTAESCTGMPRAWGYLGLVANGQNYFRNNLQKVALLSGYPAQEITANPTIEFQAYAAAYTQLRALDPAIATLSTPQAIRSIVQQLSFIPDTGAVNLFARDAETYEILRFMNSPEYQQQYDFPAYHFNLREVFGNANYDVLSSPRIVFTPTGISTPSGISYKPAVGGVKSTQYGPAIFNPAPSCNFSSRNGVAISAITIHTIQGTYAGAISWAQNCSSSVSYHYVVRSSDGQITQMVLEEDKAWHVGSENPYTIGYEHEGYVDQPQWYTEAMYTASADLSRDIVGSGYGIPALRTYYGASSAVTQTLGGCTKIKGHQHFPNQTHTDPGINWDWEHYYRLINNNPAITSLTAASGAWYDSGGAAANYTDDERQIWVFQPTNAASVTITFSQFSVESGYDKLFVYDGNSINAPLLGVFTGNTSPGTIIGSGAALTLEFRSDCSTTGTGWSANWTSTSVDDIPPTSIVQSLPDFQTENFSVSFTDADAGLGVARSYYNVSDRADVVFDWHGNADYGFLHETFDNEEPDLWTEVTGDWFRTGQHYELTDITQSNSNASTPLMQDSLSEYVFHWTQNITTAGANQRAGAHFFCDNTALPNRGNSYFVYLREASNLAQIYEVINDTWTLQAEDTVVINNNTTYDVKVSYNPTDGLIRLYVNDVFAVEWTDPDPLKSGNGFSLRSGGCAVKFDNIRVWKSRYNVVELSVGADSLLRYQSMNLTTAAKVSSLVIDYSDNWSDVASEEYFIDWTAPEVAYLNDGISGADIDTIYTPVVSANWFFNDLHSGMSSYSVAVGTSSSAQDILPWTNAGLLGSLNHVLANPVLGTTYYVFVRGENQAGLVFESVSDGQILLEEEQSNAGLEQTQHLQLLVYPQPANESVTIIGNWQDASAYVYDMTGRKIAEYTLSGSSVTIPVRDLASGQYQLLVSDKNSHGTCRIMVEHNR